MTVVLAVTRPEQVREPVHKVQPVARTKHVRLAVNLMVAVGAMALGPTTAVVHVPETGKLAEATATAATPDGVAVPNKPRVRNRKT